MSISARNRFPGTISAVIPGPINAQVALTLAGGDKIVAIVTNDSVKNLGLVVGKAATAFVKAPWVLVLAGDEDGLRFSARNHLAGTVEAIEKGAVNAEVAVRLPGGTLAYAVITNEALLELRLKPGVPAALLFKASHVILGVAD
jgi:molybdate transport system regulatory protein